MANAIQVEKPLCRGKRMSCCPPLPLSTFSHALPVCPRQCTLYFFSLYSQLPVSSAHGTHRQARGWTSALGPSLSGSKWNRLCFCSHSRFWLAVQDLKKQPLQDVAKRVEEIWQEFLAPGAPSAINLDSHSYETTSQNVKDGGRYTFEDAQVCL